MSNLDKIKMKEDFISQVEMVDLDSVMNAITNNVEGLDLYTYFVTIDAFNRGEIDRVELREFVTKLYSDWYFLAKNTNKNIKAVKLFDNYRYSPLGINSKECFELIKSREYIDVIPISIEYTNKLEEKFLVSIKLDKLFNMQVEEDHKVCRLYLNLPYNKIIPFVSEFVDRCYMETIPANIKFFSDDERCDDVIIYCDYDYAEKIIQTIEDIKNDYVSKLDETGEVNPLLGKVNEYIGFGEQPKKGTYFGSRAECLSCINKMAKNQIIKENFVAQEKQVVYKRDGSVFTPTEYLRYLIEKTAIVLIEDKILKLENLSETINADRELGVLYRLREDISKIVNIDSSVKSLKKSLTRKGDYKLNIDGIGESDFDFVDKLYNVFAPVEDKYLKKAKVTEKKKLIADNIFKVAEKVEGKDVREYLLGLFKNELSIALDKIVEENLDETKYSRQSSIINNLKIKNCMRLKKIIKAILNDSDEGMEYISKCVNDYIRIISTDGMENVELEVEGNRVIIDSDIADQILFNFPELLQDVEKLSLDENFISKVLSLYYINKDNLCINAITKNVGRKRRNRRMKSQNHFYYEPNENYRI